MPRKIRAVKAVLCRAGFSEVPGKGSHTGWRHVLISDKLTVSGAGGDDARPYRERLVRTSLATLEEARTR